MKRGVSLLLVMILAVTLLFTSCNRTYNEKEVKDAAEILLRDSMMLNSVYFGDGIHSINSDKEKGNYREADPAHLNELGFTTITELKALTYKTFSVKEAEKIFSTVLSPLQQENGTIVLNTRYYQGVDEETKLPTHIMVYRNYKQLFEDRLVGYDFSSLKVEGSKGDVVYLTVDLTVENEKGDSQVANIRFSLFEEIDGWKLNSATYANYNEYLDSEFFN